MAFLCSNNMLFIGNYKMTVLYIKCKVKEQSKSCVYIINVIIKELIAFFNQAAAISNNQSNILKLRRKSSQFRYIPKIYSKDIFQRKEGRIQVLKRIPKDITPVFP